MEMVTRIDCPIIQSILHISIKSKLVRELSKFNRSLEKAFSDEHYPDTDN